MATNNFSHNGNQDSAPYDRDLQQVMADGPTLNNMSSVQGDEDIDLSAGYGQPQQPIGGPRTAIPRSHTVPPATSSVPYGSHTNGNQGYGARPRPVAMNAASKLDFLKSWGINTYKCTKQVISEKLGKTTKTVDAEMESKIKELRETQQKYAHVLKLARILTSHFFNMVQTQRALEDSFTELAQKSPDLEEEFGYNAETQRALCRNGDVLIGALNFFTSSVNTLCNKTIEDTLLTVKNYETARVEFDAYRADFEASQAAPKDNAAAVKLEENRKKFEFHKQKFEQLRSDVNIKLQFLDENRVKVMHKQLLLFHNAISAYFSGNQTALEGTLKQFNIKLKAPNTEPPSWLEN